jgi:thiamine-monophosphate kinase
MTRKEFAIIEKFFTHQKISRDDVILSVGDDAAVITPPANQQLVITTDTLIADTHFFANFSAEEIGYYALAVNLSDLAAMGATPAFATLALTLPEANEIWLKKFSEGFFSLAEKFNVQLIGGDTTRGPLSITIAAHGYVPKNKFISRSGAKPGDLIYVTNTLGNAAHALSLKKFHRPQPQIEIGIFLRNIASAAIDISDGLAADLTHILEKSQVGATVFVDQLPSGKNVPADKAIEYALTGGDDYELCFTVPKEKISQLKKMADNITCVGSITDSAGLHLQYQDGKKYDGNTQGYSHF